MTRALVTVMPSTTVAEAARLMLEHGVSGLPVVDEQGDAVGIITEADLIRRAEIGTEARLSWWRAFVLGTERLADQYVHSHGSAVAEVMTRSVVSVKPTTSLAEAVALMQARSVKRLLVIDGKRLLGIVSRADLLRALEQLLEKKASKPSPATSDAAIRRQLLTQLQRERWVPQPLIDVKVVNGAVHLCGLILNEGQRQALHVLAENTPGVGDIVDELVWIEPHSGAVLQLPPADRASSATASSHAGAAGG